MANKDIHYLFDEKVKELETQLPKIKQGANCAELTLTSILDILGIDSYLFHNIAMPLAGGFGGYKSEKGWQGACGALTGGCAAMGAIMGGQRKMSTEKMVIAYLKAAKYATEFEKEFGTVVCSELCGYDFSDPNDYIMYSKDKIWSKKCYKYVVWAVDKVRNLTRKDLKRYWQ
ncbi:MAG: C-GCAxxG-C-C family protein [Candidatus Heimdallarchaeota archaeon]